MIKGGCHGDQGGGCHGDQGGGWYIDYSVYES